MRILTRIKNALFLRRVLKGKVTIKNRQQYETIICCIPVYKSFSKGSKERLLMAAVVKKLRTTFPYETQGWAQAEKMYKEYYQLPRHIKFKNLKVGDYITRYREDYPVRGYKEHEYYINKEWMLGRTLPVTENITEYDKKHNYYSTDKGNTVDEENITSYLFATKEEVKQHKREYDIKEAKLKKIDKLQREIRHLQGQL